MSPLTRQDISKSLADFKRRREALLHEDETEMEYHLRRFVEFCDTDGFVQQVISKLPIADSTLWWSKLSEQWFRRGIETIEFPPIPDEEIALRLSLMRDVISSKQKLFDFGNALGAFKHTEMQQRFLSLIVRPFCEELSDRLSNMANLPSDEARALQAVPINRIPAENEIKIFLSHKTEDKPLVERYYKILKELGFQPWLDISEMPAGTNLARGIVKGIKESCAVVFFVTDHFKDERFLAEEIEYAKLEKIERNERFAIITLCFLDQAKIPDLLKPYTYIQVKNELEGLYAIIRGLPVELGPIRWKEKVIRET